MALVILEISKFRLSAENPGLHVHLFGDKTKKNLPNGEFKPLEILKSDLFVICH